MVCQINQPWDGKSFQDVYFLKRPAPREQTRHVFFFLAHSTGVITAGVRAKGNDKAAQSLSCNNRGTCRQLAGVSRNTLLTFPDPSLPHRPFALVLVGLILHPVTFLYLKYMLRASSYPMISLPNCLH